MTITFFSLKGLVESLFLWYDHPRNALRAGVAQSAEQRFCKPQVGGSIPLASSIPQTIPLFSRLTLTIFFSLRPASEKLI